MTSYSEKMIEAIEDQDFVNSQILFQQALRHDETDLLDELGSFLLTEGYIDDAKEIYLELKKREPDWSEYDLALAEIYLDEGKTDDAIDVLLSINKEDDNYIQSLLLLADVYESVGLADVSRSKILEAKKLLPDEPIIDFALAELYFSIGDWQQALGIYLELSLLDLTFYEVNIDERIGSSYSRMGYFEEAIPFLESAFEANERESQLFQLAFNYAQLEENEKAIALFQQLRYLNPDYVSLYLPLARALYTEEMLEEAQEVLNDGIKHDSEQIELYYLASETAYRLQQSETAHELLQKALSIDPSNDNTVVKLADLLIAEEDYEEAIAVLQPFSVADNALIGWMKAQGYNGLELFEDAVKEYETALPLLSDEPDFLKDYGYFLREEGDNELARSLFEKYVRLIPEDEEVLRLLDEI